MKHVINIMVWFTLIALAVGVAYLHTKSTDNVNMWCLLFAPIGYFMYMWLEKLDTDY
jgi:uncharacterized membrane protein